MKAHRDGERRRWSHVGLLAGLAVAGLVLWGVFEFTDLLDLLQACDFALG